MRLPLLNLLLGLACLGPSVAVGDEGTATLRMLLDGADVVVLGQFTSEVHGQNDESGIVHYQGKFEISRLIKGEAAGDRRAGATITVNAIRYEMKQGDRSAELRKGAAAILFLTCNDRQSPPTYLVSDNWLGIQPPAPAMTQALAEMVTETPRPVAIAGLSAAGREILEIVKPVEVAKELVRRQDVEAWRYRLDQPAVHAYCPPQQTKYDWLVTFPGRSGQGDLFVAVTNDRAAWRLDPNSLDRIGAAVPPGPPVADKTAETGPEKAALQDGEVQSALAKEGPAAQPQSGAAGALAGRWRMFLPAGFEYHVKLLHEEGGGYRVDAGGLVFGGHYAAEGGYLVSGGGGSGEKGVEKGGVFKWRIQSPYLLTLIEQPAKSSSDYLGAVLVRPSPAAELRLERDQPKGPAAWVPRTTLTELDRLVEAGNYTQVRQRMLGYQLESIGVVRSVSRSHPDWVLVDLPGKHWGATLRNVHADHGLEPGDKVKFRGMIVDEGYSSLTIWLYESDKVKFYSNEGAGLKFHDKQSFPFHAHVPATELKVEIVAAERVQRMKKHLILPVKISNGSGKAIETALAHEWHGGLWPPTAISASVTPEGDQEDQPFQAVYRWGNSSELTKSTMLSPGESLDLELRMDWKGTGSVPADPLMTEPGKYRVRLALVFKAGEEEQYVISPEQTIEVAEADQEK